MTAEYGEAPPQPHAPVRLNLEERLRENPVPTGLAPDVVEEAQTKDRVSRDRSMTSRMKDGHRAVDRPSKSRYIRRADLHELNEHRILP